MLHLSPSCCLGALRHGSVGTQSPLASMQMDITTSTATCTHTMILIDAHITSSLNIAATIACYCH